MTARSKRRAVVVGASVAGVSAVEALRDGGFEGDVILVGAEAHMPYDRPPLSKQLLAGAWDTEQVMLRPAARYSELDVELRLGVSATSLDVSARAINLDNGEALRYDRLLIATGANPRLPGFVRPLEGVHLLRTLGEALGLRSALLRRPRVVVIGAGFIGSEVAATARGMGCEVTVLEALASPMAQALGAAVGEKLGRLHSEHGVVVVCNATVAGLVGDGVVEAVQLEDGSRVPADVVIVGTGVSPATAWLEGAGLAVSDGVECDQFCRAAPHVYAAGDVARWAQSTGKSVRVEHWTNAVEQGRHAAHNLIASLHGLTQRPYAPTPYFWSDQHGRKIHFVGWSSSEAEILALDETRIVVLYARDERLCGALTLDAPRALAMLRPLVAREAPLADARATVAAAGPARRPIPMENGVSPQPHRLVG